MRTELLNEMAVSSDDSLRTGPEPSEGLRHGVPVEGPHHLHDLWDQVRSFVVRLCIDLRLRRRHTQNSPMVYSQTSWEARSPSPTRQSQRDSYWASPVSSYLPPTWIDLFSLHKLCISSPLTPSFTQLFWKCSSPAPRSLAMSSSRSSAHNLFQVHPARSSEIIMTVVASSWFILAWMCLFVFVYTLANSWDGFERNNQYL